MSITPLALWQALDDLAFQRGLSPSGLAKAAGLDATTFNPSRRRGAQGAYRWPALSSLLAALAVLNVSLSAFARHVEGAEGAGVPQRSSRLIPSLYFSQLSGSGLFDELGHPAGLEWEPAAIPGGAPAGAYAVRVDNAMLEPVIREGSSLIVLPDLPPRLSDRVLLTQAGQPPHVGIWHGGSPASIAPLLDAMQDSVPQGQINVPERASSVWVHRIIMITL
ncbi:MAG: helix-turn-helix transcriptional regulator [Acetobacter sp.]|uniref:helix-turn-helix transcriptional regulator n=1 Tax=Acetobacter sp. TaxID=440 RepID=UPI003F93DB9E